MRIYRGLSTTWISVERTVFAGLGNSARLDVCLGGCLVTDEDTSEIGWCTEDEEACSAPGCMHKIHAICLNLLFWEVTITDAVELMLVQGQEREGESRNGGQANSLLQGSPCRPDASHNGLLKGSEHVRTLEPISEPFASDLRNSSLSPTSTGHPKLPEVNTREETAHMAQGTSGIATREPRTRGKTTFLEFSSKEPAMRPKAPGWIPIGCPRRRTKGLGGSLDSRDKGGRRTGAHASATLSRAANRVSSFSQRDLVCPPLACSLAVFRLSAYTPQPWRRGFGAGEQDHACHGSPELWTTQSLHSVCPVFGLPVQDYEIVQ
ncbi:hypothetical protein lerEdw1_014262 [Lerista edwardsae]|nr:hypothetical protein lerEdw1_014264 [Lerista edwardsae]KAJ6633911.1 hypothetical protein lerEdw1_014262 [Lerista edwardsae]